MTDHTTTEAEQFAEPEPELPRQPSLTEAVTAHAAEGTMATGATDYDRFSKIH
jgi:hypothetical protein